MTGTFTVNVSGKVEIDLDFFVTISSVSPTTELRSILRPIERPRNLALTEISEPGNAQLDLPTESNDENVNDEGVLESLATVSSSLARSRSDAPELCCPSLSSLDTDWLPSLSPPEYLGANWLDPASADVFGSRVVESIANAFAGILDELHSSGNDDNDGTNEIRDDEVGNELVDVAEVDVAEVEMEDDVVFLYEIVRS